jgi:hypothetical protein
MKTQNEMKKHGLLGEGTTSTIHMFKENSSINSSSLGLGLEDGEKCEDCHL